MSSHSANCHCSQNQCHFTVMSPVDNVMECYFTAQQTPCLLRLAVVQILLMFMVQMGVYLTVLHYTGPQGATFRAAVRDWSLHCLWWWFPGNSNWFWRNIDQTLMRFLDEDSATSLYLLHPQGPAEFARIYELNCQPGRGPPCLRHRNTRPGSSHLPDDPPTHSNREEVDCVIKNIFHDLWQARGDPIGGSHTHGDSRGVGSTWECLDPNCLAHAGRDPGAAQNHSSSVPAQYHPRFDWSNPNLQHPFPSVPICVESLELCIPCSRSSSRTCCRRRDVCKCEAVRDQHVNANGTVRTGSNAIPLTCHETYAHFRNGKGQGGPAHHNRGMHP